MADENDNPIAPEDEIIEAPTAPERSFAPVTEL